jgi:hypothetical protein
VLESVGDHRPDTVREQADEAGRRWRRPGAGDLKADLIVHFSGFDEHVVNDIEPAKEAVNNGPEERMVEIPRKGDRDHGSEGETHVAPVSFAAHSPVLSVTMVCQVAARSAKLADYKDPK